MTGLEIWLERATRRLSYDSWEQVRSEIQEHYESAREAAISDGAEQDEAVRLALAALGDPKTANRQYRRVLLTEREAKMLREANWEARAICSHNWLMKRLLVAAPAAALLAAGGLFLGGAIAGARVALAVALVMGMLFSMPLLPVYTPSRSRIFRGVKWVILVGGLAQCFGPVTFKSGVWISYFWYLTWIETTRASIRRKLPIEKWPKQLYL